MTQFTLVYAQHNNAATTVELTVEAQDERWAMREASEMLAMEPGNNAWVLQSITNNERIAA
jgi:hypothetical protein